MHDAEIEINHVIAALKYIADLPTDIRCPDQIFVTPQWVINVKLGMKKLSLL